MLTESEKTWLEEREQFPDEKFCRWCPYNYVRGRQEEEGVYVSCDAEESSEYHECLTEHYYFNRLWEAAAFESRVAAKLADITFCTFRDWNDRCFQILPFTRLREARLVVEQEMDSERNPFTEM